MCHEKCKLMQKREMRGIDHDCYCISKTHSRFFGIFLKYENRRKSIFSVKKGNEIQVSLHSLLTHCSRLCRHVPTQAKIPTRLQVSFPYYFELVPFKAVNSSYKVERMSSFSLAISKQCILPFFYRRLDRLCLSL